MSLNEPNVHRPAKPAYRGRNGFLRGPTEPHDIPSLALARDDHQRALYIIEHKKRPVPDFEAMKTEIERTDDVVALKERIQELKTERDKDLELLCDIQSNDYLNEIMDRYASKAELPPEDIEGLKALERISGPLKDVRFDHDWANDRNALHYAYLSTVTPLRLQLKDFEEKEAELARKRAQMFPQTKDDFKTKANDIKLRAAKFLCADPARQERMLTEYQWAWRQVKPLQDIFAKDDQFRAEIQGMVIAANTAARDPRKRTSLNA